MQKRILVVDDDLPSLLLMQELLVLQGHAVVVAEGRQQALRLFEKLEHGFDLLVTDIVLREGERGYELAWKLMERDPALRVLLVSAHAQLRDGMAMAIPAPRSAFIEKPFNPDLFVNAVRTLLA